MTFESSTRGSPVSALGTSAPVRRLTRYVMMDRMLEDIGRLWLALALGLPMALGAIALFRSGVWWAGVIVLLGAIAAFSYLIKPRGNPTPSDPQSRD